jgi:PAS domain S-box-containing protein
LARSWTPYRRWSATGDTDLRNRFANRAYVEFLGLTPEEIRGRHASEVLGPELYALNRAYIERALAGERQLFERAIIDPSGAPRHVQESYIPDVSDGKVRGLLDYMEVVVRPDW